VILLPIALLSLSAASPPMQVSTTLTPLRSDCATVPTKVGGDGKVRFSRLGDLPDAHSEIAVNRTVRGCPAPMIVRYNVSK